MEEKQEMIPEAVATLKNARISANNLYVSEIFANQGPTMKRIRPAAKGSAVRIRKRTSHITIKLRERA